MLRSWTRDVHREQPGFFDKFDQRVECFLTFDFKPIKSVVDFPYKQLGSFRTFNAKSIKFFYKQLESFHIFSTFPVRSIKAVINFLHCHTNKRS
jgi:hypothetical protein